MLFAAVSPLLVLLFVCAQRCCLCGRRKNMSNGQKRVHPEGTRPKPGTLLAASRMAPSHWPTTAQPRSWPHFKRVHPILATHPPTATRFQSRLPDYGQATRPAAHSRTRLQQPRLASRVTVCTVFYSRRGILGGVALHYVQTPAYWVRRCFVELDVGSSTQIQSVCCFRFQHK